MRKKTIIYVILIQIVFATGISSIKAQWMESGVPVSISDGRQMRPFLAPDGLGGAIITWEDYRNGDDEVDIYAQRVDADGYVKWAINGIAVCDTNDKQLFARIVSDGAGGAIIVWRDRRNGNYDIYAQRLNGNGTALWTTNGVAVCTAPADQHGPSITSDGNNGAIIAWKDFRDGHDDYYAQRIDSDGAPQWILNGIAISTIEVGYFEPINYPEIISDGSGRAIIAWADKRSGTDMIYAQRVDTDGNVLWTEDGVVVSNTLVRQSMYKLVSDSSGGTITTWKAERTDVTYHNDIYAQRIRSDGSIAWDTEGVPVCSSSTWGATAPRLAESEDGSAIITWYDMRTGDAHIYAQMVDSLGIDQWVNNGITICDAPGTQGYPRIISDGSFGAVIAWKDDRYNKNDIYIQRVQQNGLTYWTPDGIPFYEGGSYLFLGFLCMISDNYEGALITWHEDRAVGSQYDIYIKKIYLDGTIPVSTLLHYFSTSLNENIVNIKWALSEVIDNVIFLVMRAEGEDGIFQEVISQDIRIDENLYTLTDYNCEYGSSYQYRIEYLSNNERYVLFETDLISIPPMPTKLYQNYPNPFNPTTTIRYSVRERCHVKLEIFDAAGRRLTALIDRVQPGGNYNFDWNGCDAEGHTAASGIYFYQLKAGKETISRKMILLR